VRDLGMQYLRVRHNHVNTFTQIFEDVMALLLKVQVFEEVTLCCWVNGLLIFEGMQGV
jgi:hypothetical protein